MATKAKSFLVFVQLVCILGFFNFSGCAWLTGAAGQKSKPDLRVQTIREGAPLKMGNTNIVEIYVQNSMKTAANESMTKLEIREGRNAPNGGLVGSPYFQRTPAISGHSRTKVLFKGVMIPKTEQGVWYTLVGTADANGQVDEYKEDNNTKHTSRYVDR